MERVGRKIRRNYFGQSFVFLKSGVGLKGAEVLKAIISLDHMRADMVKYTVVSCRIIREIQEG